MKNFVRLLAFLAVVGWAGNASAVDWNWKGDIMYRYQVNDEEGVSHNRDYHLMRVRVGAFPWISEELSAGVELSTAGDKPVSRMQVLGDGFTSKSFNLNQAYIDFHPAAYGLDGKLNVVAGKRDVAQSIIRVNDLVWDNDLTLEGLTLQYGKNGKKQLAGINAVAGYYFIDEVNDSESDPFFWVSQLAFSGSSNDLSYLVGAGYYNFQNIGGKSVDGWAYNDGLYNNTGTDSMMTYDYDVLEVFANAGTEIAGSMPVKLYGQYAVNIADGIDDDTNAWLLGATIGKAKKTGQWELDANYCTIEKDAILGAFTDGTRYSGGTDGKGFEVGGKYMMAQNLTVALKYYNHEKGVDVEESDNRVDIWQGDMIVRF